jgi:heavy metal sensor kinase
MRMLKSFRVQLTIWYVAFIAFLLVAFTIFLYTLISRNLYAQLDATLSRQVATTAGLFSAELAEPPGEAVSSASEAVSQMRWNNSALAILNGLQLLAVTEPKYSKELTAMAAMPVATASPTFFWMPEFGPKRVRVAIMPITIDGIEYRVVASAPLDAISSQLSDLRRIFWIVLPLTLFAAGLGGFLLVTRNLAPVVTMSKQAEEISERNLDRRLQIGTATEELSRLADSFNELLARLDHSFEAMKRFTADASHELRTPLAVIRGEVDVALGRDRQPEEYKQSLRIVQDEAKRLSRLVDDLLSLSRADAGQRTVLAQEFYLNDLIQECCRSVQTLAAAGNIQLIFPPPDDISYRGDEEMMRRLIFNLLDNAIRYTPPGGIVSARLENENDRLRIIVSDTGIGIPAEAAPHVFERFYRVDKARSRRDGGFGLGLAIVKWIAESHNGRVELTSTSERGSTFTVTLGRNGGGISNAGA